MMRMRRKLKSYNSAKPDIEAEISEFLKNPLHHLSDFYYDSSEYMFTFNPQFIFFGYPSYLASNEEKLSALVDFWISEIDKDFSLDKG
jgi:hypothetical protein